MAKLQPTPQRDIEERDKGREGKDICKEEMRETRNTRFVCGVLPFVLS